MKKINDKTTVDRLFNGLLGEQGMWSLCKVLLCLFLFLSGTAVCAQSNDSIPIVFEKVPVDEEFDEIGQPERDLESVIYYIMDENGIIIATDEIDFPKNVEQTIDISSLPNGTYFIILNIDERYFIGELLFERS